jgi:TonB family protein
MFVVAFCAMVPRLTIVLFFCCWITADSQSVPTIASFEIGQHTFFDFGPPSDFYEMFLVKRAPDGSSIERITLTPAVDSCTQVAKVEIATGAIRESIADLLGNTNPCAIPEKELRRERKRCKHCLVFSGANVGMQIQCGGTLRIIRADVLDRDMFDPAPNTPEHTSWTMRLLSQIDGAVGPGVIDRPAFAIQGKEETAAPIQESETLHDIGVGKYDDLFEGAPDKPSELFRASQIPPPVPTVHLISSEPFHPENFVQPGYPPLARLARIQGTVSFAVDVNPDGTAANFTVLSGHPMLRPASEKAVRGWTFSKDAAGQRIQSAVEFVTNCPVKKQ